MSTSMKLFEIISRLRLLLSVYLVRYLNEVDRDNIRYHRYRNNNIL